MFCLTRRSCLSVLFLSLMVGLLGAAVAVATPPKNIIIVIADGFGFNAYRAASFYRSGSLGKQVLDSFPVHLSTMTLAQREIGVGVPASEIAYDADAFWKSVAGARSSSPTTVTTDSAAAATAMFSGVKTVSRRIGMDGGHVPKRLRLLSEIATESGKAVGTVTTVQASHATPAGFAAHNVDRDNYADIFTEIYRKTPLRVIAGAGHPLLLVGEPDGKDEYKYVGSPEIWDEIFVAMSKPQTRNDRYVKIAPARLSIPPVDGMSEHAPPGEELRLRDVYKIPNGVMFPTLAAWATDALDTLQVQGKGKGLLLMVEAGAIDWANHDRHIDRCVWECTSMFKAVEAMIVWVEKNSSWDETLLIVTSDHETGPFWGPGTYDDANNNGMFDDGDVFNRFVPICGEKAGFVPRVQYCSDGHTSALVPLWARGAGADLFLERVRGRDPHAAEVWEFSGDFIDNTDIFHVVNSCLDE
ncbi:MAG: alkaline phosphatase [Thermoguttaceae bacterium]